MKVLGVIFDTKLDWTPQVESVIKKTTKILHGLKYIRKYVNVKQAKHVITAYYYSTLFYGLEVWFHQRLAFKLKHKIRLAHSRALRVIRG